MKNFLIVLFLLLQLAYQACCQPTSQPRATDEQRTSARLEKIRASESQLTAFFHAMPKGGDLHNHFSGAVYAETMFDTAVSHHFLYDTISLLVYDPTQQHPTSPTIIALDTVNASLRNYFKSKLIRLWSVKDFSPCDGAPDAHFFNTFGLFGATIWGSEVSMLQELKLRAIAEHVQYLETMFQRPSLNGNEPTVREFISSYTPPLRNAAAAHDSIACRKLFDKMFEDLKKGFDIDSLAKTHHARLAAIYAAATLPDGEDSLITVRFQNYVTRTSQPADVFAQLMLSFLSCDDDSLLVGVNIVAPENNDVALRDYWLHMRMFQYFRHRFPAVHVAMHAGELVRGMVKPEELTWHITDAVETAGAQRIGHGVDIANEKHADGLLDEMRAKNIAVEINLTSNEFILGVKNGAHPVTLYAAHNVPIVISTDDPGVLRSDDTGEFVKLALRYPQFSYADIKKIIFNSVMYSFLKGRDKDTMFKRLAREFQAFEMMVGNEDAR